MMQHFWSLITEIHVFLRHFTFSVYAKKKRMGPAINSRPDHMP